MARKSSEIKEVEEISSTSKRTAFDYLKKHSTDHLNDVEPTDYIVSSGSLLLDVATQGGFHPSVIRMIGISEGGKSSCAYSVMKNFFDTVPNSKGLTIPSEGRLKANIKERSGVKFVRKPEEWDNKTCLVYQTNIFESAIGLIRELVLNNPDDHKYIFMIDSVDALVPRHDINGGFEQANQVAGGALLSSDFLRKLSNAISIRGHTVILISQRRARDVAKGKYDKKEQTITPDVSGGNALIHYSDWILDFQARYQNDIIWSGEKDSSERLGHFCHVIFRKTPNEKSGVKVSYPIRYGQTGGGSVWVEYEIIDMMLMWGFAVQKGAWITIEDKLIKEIKDDTKEEIPKQHNGMKNLREYLEANPKITKHLFNRFKNIMT